MNVTVVQGDLLDHFLMCISEKISKGIRCRIDL
jgi:hypothetical protein